MCPPPLQARQPPEGREFCVLCSMSRPQHLEQRLVRGRTSINECSGVIYAKHLGQCWTRRKGPPNSACNRKNKKKEGEAHQSERKVGGNVDSRRSEKEPGRSTPRNPEGQRLALVLSGGICG